MFSGFPRECVPIMDFARNWSVDFSLSFVAFSKQKSLRGKQNKKGMLEFRHVRVNIRREFYIIVRAKDDELILLMRAMNMWRGTHTIYTLCRNRWNRDRERKKVNMNVEIKARWIESEKRRASRKRNAKIPLSILTTRCVCGVTMSTQNHTHTWNDWNNWSFSTCYFISNGRKLQLDDIS